MITRLTSTATAVARGDRDGTLTVCDLASSQVRWHSCAHTGPIRALEWSPDGTFLASGGRDGMVHLFQAASGVCCCSFDHGRAVRRLEWSPDSASLCVASGRTVHLIRLNPKEEHLPT